MKRTFLSAAILFTLLLLAGCGDGHHHDHPPQIVTDILSDPLFDGDIEQTAPNVFTVAQGNTQSVFAGINPTTGAEFRAFLDFPLTGTGGVPGNAVIVSAVLDVVITSILPNPLVGTIPIRIDLVNFQPPTLIATDFDRTLQPALLSVTIIPPISQSDFGNHVAVDVTPLMEEVQRLGLPDFQLRILEDPGAPSAGLIEINDTTGANRNLLAPLLQVTYF